MQAIARPLFGLVNTCLLFAYWLLLFSGGMVQLAGLLGLVLVYRLVYRVRQLNKSGPVQCQSGAAGTVTAGAGYG